MFDLRVTYTNEEVEQLAPILEKLRDEIAARLLRPDANFEAAIGFNALRKIEAPLVEHLRAVKRRERFKREPVVTINRAGIPKLSSQRRKAAPVGA